MKTTYVSLLTLCTFAHTAHASTQPSPPASQNAPSPSLRKEITPSDVAAPNIPPQQPMPARAQQHSAGSRHGTAQSNNVNDFTLFALDARVRIKHIVEQKLRNPHAQLTQHETAEIKQIISTVEQKLISDPRNYEYWFFVAFYSVSRVENGTVAGILEHVMEKTAHYLGERSRHAALPVNPITIQEAVRNDFLAANDRQENLRAFLGKALEARIQQHLAHQSSASPISNDKPAA